MVTTLQNLLDDFRIETRDPNGQLFQDEDAIYALNAAYLKCYSHILKQNKDYFLTSQLISLVANQRAYDLPATFARMKRVEYVRDNNTIPLFERIRGVDAAYIGPSVASASFGIFTFEFEGDTIIFEPTPQYSATGVIKITFYPTPTEISDVGDEINEGFKDHWRNYIVLEAIWSAYSQIEAVGGRINKADIEERLKSVRNMVDDEIALRTLSPRIRRKRKYFR